VVKAGTIFSAGSNTGLSLGARAAGDIIGIALDLGARLIWFRVAPSGNWNGSGTANPATGTGGVSIAGLGSPAITPLYAMASFAASADAATGNFGDTAFSGTVPSGFTSGFTAGASIPNYAVATQIALEEWGVGTPRVQLTQIAIEEWASVANAPAVTSQIYVMVMA
jgi:hypothetical protein